MITKAKQFAQTVAVYKNYCCLNQVVKSNLSETLAFTKQLHSSAVFTSTLSLFFITKAP